MYFLYIFLNHWLTINFLSYLTFIYYYSMSFNIILEPTLMRTYHQLNIILFKTNELKKENRKNPANKEMLS